MLPFEHKKAKITIRKTAHTEETPQTHTIVPAVDSKDRVRHARVGTQVSHMEGGFFSFNSNYLPGIFFQGCTNIEFYLFQVQNN